MDECPGRTCCCGANGLRPLSVARGERTWTLTTPWWCLSADGRRAVRASWWATRTKELRWGSGECRSRQHWK